MNKNGLQTKRKAKTGFRKIYAQTMLRRQQASVAADMDEMEGDIPKVGIGKSLTVILLLHVAAITAIYIGTQWNGSDPEQSNAVVAYDEDAASNSDSTSSNTANANNEHRFRVGQPASYQPYEHSPQVEHEMPAPSVLSSEVQPEVAAAPRQPRVIRPKRNPNAQVYQATPETVEYKSYTMASGDTIYRVALRNNVKQQEILDLNNIADARKMRVGMVIKIPVK